MFGIDINLIVIGGFGVVGWIVALTIYSKLTTTQTEKDKLRNQKETLRDMISSEMRGKYENEISELKRYQTQYLVHMEERDKILSSLSTLINKS